MSDVQLCDPVIDLANGRAILVVGRAADRADEWSDRNGYDLLGNYGNERCGAEPDDTVWTCVYVASLQSEPSKTYAFPESRLGRVAYERADDDIERVYDLVALDVLERLFDAALRSGQHQTLAILEGLAQDALDKDTTDEARELARAARLGADQEDG